jgi:hypothetical protein
MNNESKTDATAKTAAAAAAAGGVVSKRRGQPHQILKLL